MQTKEKLEEKIPEDKTELNWLRFRLYVATAFHNFFNFLAGKRKPDPIRILYACPVGRYGMDYLPEIIREFSRWPHIQTHFLLFNYELLDFSDPLYKDCEVIDGAGYKWELIRKHVTPEYCKPYDLIFLWDDDIDVFSFSLKNFTDIFYKNHLQVAQPALTRDSYCSHEMTLKERGLKTGRYTDFVEIMVPVFSNEAWSAFYEHMDEDTVWGWGMDEVAHSLCGYRNLAIVDCESVKHTRPTGSYSKVGIAELKATRKKFENYRSSQFLSYGRLRK